VVVRATNFVQQQDYYLAGRWLSIAYEVAAIPLVYLLGRKAFGATTGLIGASLTAFLPIAISHAQVVRTDSAALFFGMLSLWLILRLADHTTWRRLALAACAIGLAIASRYFMVALLAPLMVAVRPRNVRKAASGITLALVAFLAASPFVALDAATVLESVAAENESSHVGADGLSPIANFVWYLTRALPADLTWPVALLALIGIGLAVRRRTSGVVLIAYIGVHLVLISASALHWHRWTIQILPVLAIFCGFAIQALLTPTGLRAAVTAAAAVQLALQTLVYDLQQIQPAPRILAREWLITNAPAGTLVLQEWYGPPLADTSLRSRTRFSLAQGALDAEYAVVSSAVYDRYFSEPDRYPREADFYGRLFAEQSMLAEFRARAPFQDLLAGVAGGECYCSLHPTRGAPSLRVYRVSFSGTSKDRAT
jgi:4-amino-4-deoxy-L-arabinose transferase-like glycosyltransferase